MLDFLRQVVDANFKSYGFPLSEEKCVIPEDDTTLFVCSGMQRLKSRFAAKDGGTNGSWQSCIRTNDFELVGDGAHLTYFVMLGNFSFGGPPYEHSVRMWHAILVELGLASQCLIHVHPSQTKHMELWESLSYPVKPDDECVWSDGEIGGYCCEVYHHEREIGNLVNTLGHSTDVGFGLERLMQAIEGTKNIDDTSLFDSSLTPVVRDHSRAIRSMRENGIVPGNKGREYVCRKMLRRILRHDCLGLGFDDWVLAERQMLEQRLTQARRAWRKNKDKPMAWWWDTFGILPEEM